jgi:hypothetical protein
MPLRGDASDRLRAAEITAAVSRIPAPRREAMVAIRTLVPPQRLDATGTPTRAATPAPATTFDQDGTLWVEHPVYSQFIFWSTARGIVVLAGALEQTPMVWDMVRRTRSNFRKGCFVSAILATIVLVIYHKYDKYSAIPPLILFLSNCDSFRV